MALNVALVFHTLTRCNQLAYVKGQGHKSLLQENQTFLHQHVLLSLTGTKLNMITFQACFLKVIGLHHQKGALLNMVLHTHS